MAFLNLFLPPYSSDFSGILSVLFDLGGLSIVHDASCCTKNYVDYEEPRWERTRNSTFCSQLRTMDAILGNDEKLIGHVLDTAEEIKPPFIAVLGTPVPSITGTDMRGIGYEIENRTGIPTIGFESNGFESYDRGIEMAVNALINKFSCPIENKKEINPEKIRLNLIGVTPLDFVDKENVEMIRNYFNSNGFEVIVSIGMGYTMENLKKISSADVTLAMTGASVKPAQNLYRKYGIPYITGCPFGLKHASVLKERLRSVALGNKYVERHEVNINTSKDRILIIGEYVHAASLREALYLNGCKKDIRVASMQTSSKERFKTDDIYLKGEEDLIRLLQEKNYTKLVADRLILDMPQTAENIQKYEMVHPALSSNLYRNHAKKFLSVEFEDFMDEISK